MKVKNIMFAGFASAILSGVCGAASAADYNLVTEGYVTEKLAGKAAVGASYTKSEADALLDKKVSTETYAQYIEDQEGIDAKQTQDIATNKASIDLLSGEDGTGIATLMGDVSANKTAIETLTGEGEGSVAKKIATAIAEEELRADGKYQEKGDYVTTDGLSAEGFLKATTAAETYQPKGDYQPAGSYVTTDALTQEGFLKATTAAETYQPKGDYQPAGSYVTTTALEQAGYATTEEMNTALQGKQATIENLATIEANAAKGATAVQPGANISVLVNDSDFQTAENVNTLIGQAQIAESQVTGLTNALAGKLDVMENAGTYLVKRDGEGNISYVSVEIVGETEAE